MIPFRSRCFNWILWRRHFSAQFQASRTYLTCWTMIRVHSHSGIWLHHSYFEYTKSRSNVIQYWSNDIELFTFRLFHHVSILAFAKNILIEFKYTPIQYYWIIYILIQQKIQVEIYYRRPINCTCNSTEIGVSTNMARKMSQNTGAHLSMDKIQMKWKIL